MRARPGVVALGRWLGPLALAGAVLAGGMAGFGCGSQAPDATTTTAAADSNGKMECASCHMPEYQSAPKHVGKKPTKCAVCHTSDAWRPPVLNHRWPLTGAHQKADCFYCHKGDPVVFMGTPKACVGCHQADYDRAPGHAGRFPTTCEQCHSTTAWKPTLPHEEPPPPATTTPATIPTAPAKRAPAPHVAPTPTKPLPPHPHPAPTPNPTVEPTSHASRRL